MGKKTKLREAQRQRTEESLSAVLAAHSKRSVYPALVATYGDFKPHYCEKIEAFREQAVRAPEKWRCRIRSREEQDRFLDLVKHTFARYPVARHLESAWLANVEVDISDRLVSDIDGPSWQRPDLREWYIVAGRGESLHAQATGAFMTKLETHHFLAAPPWLSAKQAFWYAFARAEIDDVDAAVAVARTDLADCPAGCSFWKETARFFARNRVGLDEMNRLIVLVYGEKHDNPAFSLKGRTVPALLRRLEAAERARRLHSSGCATRVWSGRAMPDANYETGEGADKTIWRFRQIKNGIALFNEGERMKHCVANYMASCVEGKTSIWSLIAEFPHQGVKRSFTIEVLSDGMIGQCRGIANSYPCYEDVAMIKRWAAEFGLMARWL